MAFKNDMVGIANGNFDSLFCLTTVYDFRFVRMKVDNGFRVDRFQIGKMWIGCVHSVVAVDRQTIN